GPATDVYAATVVFFECLTGTRPFRAPNVAALARQHQSASPPVEEVPEALRSLVERGLAKSPSGRPPSAEAFLTELEAVAAEGYGPDWEERGRRRLAALAGLLVLLFPSGLDEPAETGTSLAETRFARPARLLRRLPAKIAVGAAGAGVLIAAAVVVLVSGPSEPVLRAQTSSVGPSTAQPFTPEPEEPTEEPAITLDETTPEPSRTDTVSTAPPTVAPATVLPTRTTTATPTPTPVKTPPRTRTPRPSRTATPTPTPSAEPEMSGDVEDRKPSASPTVPRATPTPVPVTPTPVPTRSTVSPPQSPSPGGEETPGGGERPTVTPEQPRLSSAGALLALGLMTTGALPVTLAVRRRRAGRHRNKR
ncbi:serine/threonine-protein kinase, partial [Nonomuraea sp. NPDC004297]